MRRRKSLNSQLAKSSRRSARRDAMILLSITSLPSNSMLALGGNFDSEGTRVWDRARFRALELFCTQTPLLF